MARAAPDTSVFTDRARLVGDAYADASKLSARQGIYRFRRSEQDAHDRLIDLVDWSGVRTLIDVGCGNAIYLARVLQRLDSAATVVGIDLSPGMLASAPHPSGRVAADAQVLPVATARVDAVMALHMLYHVPDPAKAVREFQRVLRPGGVAVVSTNGPRHLAELIALGDKRTLRGSRVLGLDAAEELLRSVFTTVDRHSLTDELVITEPEPLIDYVRSTISLGSEPKAAAALEDRIRETLETGPFVVTIDPGVLIAR